MLCDQEESGEAERVRGRVKWFSRERRFGFIQRDDGLRDVFVRIGEFYSPADVYWVRDGAAWSLRSGRRQEDREQ